MNCINCDSDDYSYLHPSTSSARTRATSSSSHCQCDDCGQYYQVIVQAGKIILISLGAAVVDQIIGSVLPGMAVPVDTITRIMRGEG